MSQADTGTFSSAVDEIDNESSEATDNAIEERISEAEESASNSDSDAGDASRQQQSQSDGGAAADGSGDGASAQRRFDPDVTTQHSYLGDVDELGGSTGLLEEGETYTLPLFALEGVVLLPGASLPLILHSAPDVLKLERALRAPAGEPTARLVAVTHVTSHLGAMCLVCCSAGVRHVRRDADLQQDDPRVAAPTRSPDTPGTGTPGRSGVVAAVARGRQRLLLDPGSLADSFRVRCRVLPERLAEAPPRQISTGAGFWAPWAVRPFDAPALAALAQRQCSGVLPQIASKLNLGRAAPSPAVVRQYSYWLAANLPLSDDQRQQLLECPDTAQRLRLLLSWLARLGGLACKWCGAGLTQCREALLMSGEGAGGAFVNAHGYVHDIATFRSVQGLMLVGRPETAHTWFPGYAWTITHCANCGVHVGWRFTATSPDLQPEIFWGLRRTAIVCPELYGTRGRARQGAAEDHANGAGVLGPGGPLGELGTDSSDGTDEYEEVYEDATDSDGDGDGHESEATGSGDQDEDERGDDDRQEGNGHA